MSRLLDAGPIAAKPITSAMLFLRAAPKLDIIGFKTVT
jgi:hypothetical protein